MNVSLLYHTNDPERAVATAARICYASIGAQELMETMTDEQVAAKEIFIVKRCGMVVIGKVHDQRAHHRAGY